MEENTNQIQTSNDRAMMLRADGWKNDESKSLQRTIGFDSIDSEPSSNKKEESVASSQKKMSALSWEPSPACLPASVYVQ